VRLRTRITNLKTRKWVTTMRVVLSAILLFGLFTVVGCDGGSTTQNPGELSTTPVPTSTPPPGGDAEVGVNPGASATTGEVSGFTIKQE
jgi:hypothetical protein